MVDDNAIEVKGLMKSFKKLNVLNGIDFSVKKGTVVALLGPNGAGKTTTVRILSTLLLPDGGQALINGFDVVKESNKVRALIGLTGQNVAIDDYLTAEENLHMMGRLYRINHADIKKRSQELIELFDLKDAAKRVVKTYSGGMKRRLDLAVSLLSSPPIIFLDEPTTGLDPRSRLLMWDIIEHLTEAGTTILLTTQDMDEADHLADRIIVIDNGKVIADGTSDELKLRVGSERLEITIAEGSNFESAKTIVDGEGLHFDEKRRTLSLATKGGVHQLKQVLGSLEDAGVVVENVSFHRPTLDDVFLTFTGHATKTNEESEKIEVKK